MPYIYDTSTDDTSAGIIPLIVFRKPAPGMMLPCSQDKTDSKRDNVAVQAHARVLVGILRYVHTRAGLNKYPSRAFLHGVSSMVPKLTTYLYVSVL